MNNIEGLINGGGGLLNIYIWAYAPNLIAFGPLIDQISIFVNETNFIYIEGKP